MANPQQASGHRQPAPGMCLGRIFGIPVYVHPSWLIIFLLITLTLADYFRVHNPAWTPAQRWTAGVLASILFFGSVLFHELSHSVVALHYKIPVRSITLFIFGGVSAIERDPPKASQEFNIAIAGPLSSVALAVAFWGLAVLFRGRPIGYQTCYWLAVTNALLAAFNLVPGFPLDGGRVLRGIAWGATKDFTRATRLAANAGRFFAYLMIFGGIFWAVNGNWVEGLWLAFIGWFLLEAARESYAQVAIRNTLVGVRAADVMTQEIPTIPRDISLEEYVHEVLRTGRRCHVVTGVGLPVGLVTLHAARSVPRDEWANTSIQAVMLPAERVHWASPDEPVLSVLERMQSEDVSQMPVVADGHIIGMIGRESILRAFQTRLRAGHMVQQ